MEALEPRVTPSVMFPSYNGLFECPHDSHNSAFIKANDSDQILPDIALQSVRHNSTLLLDITGSDPDGDDLIYEALAELYDPLHELDQCLMLHQRQESYFDNFFRANEKWLFSARENQWYFILPDGDFYRWYGGQSAGGLYIANVGPSVYDQPELLHQATKPSGSAPVDLSVETIGETVNLLVDPADDFAGLFVVTLTASNGSASSTRKFVVESTNESAQFQTEFQDQSANPGDTLVFDFFVSDADDDPVIYQAKASPYDLLFELDQQFDFVKRNGSYSTNSLGEGEKWLWSRAENNWYFVTPNGELRRWDGGPVADTSPVIAHVGDAVHLQPALLHEPIGPIGSVPIELSIKEQDGAAELTIELAPAFAGSAKITVTAGDGISSSSRSFVIDSPNSRPFFTKSDGQFAAIPDQQIGPGQYVDIPLSAVDPDGDTISYTAEIVGQNELVRDARNPIFTPPPGLGAWMYSPSAVQVGDKIFVALKTENPRAIALWMAPDGQNYRYLGLIIEPTAGAFDQAGATAPLLIYDEADGMLHLYYNGNRGGERAQVGYATASPDDPLNWTKHGVVLSESHVAEFFGWDSVSDLAVWDMVEIDGVKTWYGHASRSLGEYYLFRAESTGWTDLRVVDSYAPFGGTGGWFSPAVLQWPGQDGLTQVYSRSPDGNSWPYPWDLRWATSEDGKMWTEQGHLLDPAASGWDSEVVYAARALKEPRSPFAAPILDKAGRAKLFYSGRGSGQDIAGIAYWSVEQPATATVVAALLTVNVKEGASGQFDVIVRVTDARGASVHETFSVTVSNNQAPELAPIPDQQVLEGRTRTIFLSASDADHDPLIYSAEILGSTVEDLAFTLDQEWNLHSIGNYHTNWSGWNEKWIRAGDDTWYFLTPDGVLFHWDGTKGLGSSPRVATLDGSYYVNPARLHDAPSPEFSPAALNLRGRILYIFPLADPGSVFDIKVTVRDSEGGSDTQIFTVNIVDEATSAPVLAPISDQVVSAGQTIQVQLSAVDPNGDDLTFHANVLAPFHSGSELSRRAYEIDQLLGLYSTGDYLTNWGGWNEKWIRGSDDNWYFLAPHGGLYQWDRRRDLSSSTEIAMLAEYFYEDPMLLHKAPAPGSSQALAMLSIDGNTLSISIGSSVRGTVAVRVTAVDIHGAADRETFSVRIEN